MARLTTAAIALSETDSGPDSFRLTNAYACAMWYKVLEDIAGLRSTKSIKEADIANVQWKSRMGRYHFHQVR